MSTLAPELQETVRRIATSYDELTRSIGQSEDRSELLRRFDKLQITINPKVYSGPDVVSRGLLGRIVVGSGTDTFEIPLFDPESPIAKALGRAIIALKAGKDKDAVSKQLATDLTQVSQGGPAGYASPGDTSSDPAMQMKIRLFSVATKANLPMVLQRLAMVSGLNVISDYFPLTPVTVPGTVLTLGEALQFISRGFGTVPTKSGELICFADPDWAAKRTWEVPQVWLDYWKARNEANNGLDLDDFTQIGNLRDAQIDHTMMLDPLFVGMGAGEASRNRYLLRFYGALTADQRQTLKTRALSAGDLTDAQWTALQTALAAGNAAYAVLKKGSQTVALTESRSQMGNRLYRFSFSPGANEPLVTFELSAVNSLTLGVKPQPAPEGQSPGAAGR